MLVDDSRSIDSDTYKWYAWLSAQAKGEYEKSLKKSQNTLKKIDSWGNDRVKNKPALVANLYSCMGNANLELGKFKEALEHHKKDLSIGEDE